MPAEPTLLPEEPPQPKTAVFRIGGNLMEISHDGEIPLVETTVAQLIQPLVFSRTKLHYGRDAYTRDGRCRRASSEPCALYQYDGDGRLLCHSGWRWRLRGDLERLGYTVEIRDERPAPSSPQALDPDWGRLLSEFQFRPQQEECLIQIAIHMPEGGGIIDAVPAIGKSAIIAMLCVLYPHARIDVVTFGNELVESMYRNILQHITDVGIVGGGHRRKDRVTVYSADSLHYADGDADIVLVDEVHLAMTDNYANRLGRYTNACMFGFTATVDTRTDNAHKRMEGLFGPVIFRLGWPQAESLGLVVPITVYWQSVIAETNPVEYLQNPVARKRHGIWRHAYRNQVVAASARAFYEQGMQTLVLVETVEHVLNLKRLLPDFEVCYSEACLQDEKRRERFIKERLLENVPTMTKDRRRELRRAFEAQEIRGAIANTVWATGVSFDGLQVLARADGGASETNNVQWPGRVARIDPSTGKAGGILLDFCDEFDPGGFGSRAEGRQKDYHKFGWRQVLPDGSLYQPRRKQRGR